MPITNAYTANIPQPLITLRNFNVCNPMKKPAKTSVPWSKSIPMVLDDSNIQSHLTCPSSLLAVDVVQVLIDDDGRTHQHQFPFGQLILRKQEQHMHYEEVEEANESNEIGSHPGREECDQTISEGRPEIFVTKTVRATGVLEESKRLMVQVDIHLRSLGIQLIFFISQISQHWLILYQFDMLKITQEHHLACFDSERQYSASFTFQILQIDQKQLFQHPFSNDSIFSPYAVDFKVTSDFHYQWESPYFEFEKEEVQFSEFGGAPFSIETFIEIYHDEHQWRGILTLKQGVQKDDIVGKQVGKLIIKTRFSSNPFLLPINCISHEAPKTIKIIVNANDEKDEVICSGRQAGLILVETAEIYIPSEKEDTSKGFEVYTYEIDENVSTEHVCVLKGRFLHKELKIIGKKFRLISPAHYELTYIDNLQKTVKRLKFIGEEIIICQNIQTEIESCHKIIFYAHSCNLYEKLFRSYLLSKVEDEWIIEGIVHHTHDTFQNHQQFQQLVSLIEKGEDMFPLSEKRYSFDRVWKLKARCMYNTLVNLSSSDLTQILLSSASDKKLTSEMIFSKIKHEFGIHNLQSTYEEQFFNSTGLNKISYHMDYIKKKHTAKITLQQKSLACDYFRKYNNFRIKLEKLYGHFTPLMKEIYAKNKQNMQLHGPLAVPSFIKAIPFFNSVLSAQIENNFLFFSTLHEELESVSQIDLKACQKPMKKGKAKSDFALGTVVFLILDKSSIFPAVYEVENLSSFTMESILTKNYESELQELKVLNSINFKQYSESKKICKILIEKAKIKEGKFVVGINPKRRILQILPLFMNKLRITLIWDEYLSFLKYFEPICYDESEQANSYLLSLVRSIGQVEYCIEMSHYFDELHRILLAILKYKFKVIDEEFSELHEQIFKSMTRWTSKYSFQIIEEARINLELILDEPIKFNSLIQTILKAMLPYIDLLECDKSTKIASLSTLIKECIEVDKTGDLKAINFWYEAYKKEAELSPIDFLTETFSELDEIKYETPQAYDKCILALKDVLDQKVEKYGLQIQQQTLNENQNYFLAEYLWKKLCSRESLENSRVRLAWLKIYKVFYFYFVPIITMVKLKKNARTKEFKLDTEETTEILQNVIDFTPDINWFSNFHSEIPTIDQKKSSPFSETNIFKNYIDQNIKATCRDLMKEALKMIIQEFEAKSILKESESPSLTSLIQELNNLLGESKKAKLYQRFEKFRAKIFETIKAHQEEQNFMEVVFDQLEEALVILDRKG